MSAKEDLIRNVRGWIEIDNEIVNFVIISFKKKTIKPINIE